MPSKENPMQERARQLIEWVGHLTFGVEVGVAWGETSHSVLSNVPGVILTLVDPWPDVAVMHWVQNHLSHFERQTRFLHYPSVEAARLCAGEQFDWVFIDGDHSEEAAWADLNAWWPLVKPGGILCGHDWTWHRSPGVAISVKRFCAENELSYTVGTPESDCWRIDKDLP
jgi:predicted O-methyltransferase YrrM